MDDHPFNLPEGFDAYAIHDETPKIVVAAVHRLELLRPDLARRVMPVWSIINEEIGMVILTGEPNDYVALMILDTTDYTKLRSFSEAVSDEDLLATGWTPDLIGTFLGPGVVFGKRLIYPITDRMEWVPVAIRDGAIAEGIQRGEQFQHLKLMFEPEPAQPGN